MKRAKFAAVGVSLSLLIAGTWAGASPTRVAEAATEGDRSADEVRVVTSVPELRAALADGGRIRIAAGEYVLTESLVVDQRVEVRMDADAVLAADWSGDRTDAAVRLSGGATGSTLHGVRIDGRDNRLQGLRIDGASDVHISHLHVSDTGEQGVWVSRSERVTIRDARLRRTQTHEETGMSGAIRVQGSSDVAIERAAVWASGGKGIAFGGSRRCVVRDSTVHDTQRDAGDGFYFNNAHDSMVVGCHVIDPQGNALKISRRSSRIKVRDSTLRKERGVGYTLFIQGGLEAQVIGSHLISRTDRDAVRVSEHPIEEVGGPALRNLIQANHIESDAGRFFGQSGDVSGTVYEGNIEIDPTTEPQSDG